MCRALTANIEPATIVLRAPVTDFRKYSVKASTKVTIAVVSVTLVVIAVIVAIVTLKPFSPASEAAATTSAVAENSHRLQVAEDGKVTMVEFLDFECEVCGAVYPEIEKIRAEYADRVTFVVRYFPIPGHKNSGNAAIAVEAASQQGKFEEMYSMMFETQASWGEGQESQAAYFRTFAEALKLDMDAYDAAVADPATAERVQFDFDSGRALGVQGTPTFFVNDEMIEVASFDDIRNALDAALK